VPVAVPAIQYFPAGHEYVGWKGASEVPRGHIRPAPQAIGAVEANKQ